MIKSFKEYEKASEKLELLLQKVGDNYNYGNPDFVEMDKLSDLIADYEDENYRISKPSKIQILNLRIFKFFNSLKLLVLIIMLLHAQLIIKNKKPKKAPHHLLVLLPIKN